MGSRTVMDQNMYEIIDVQNFQGFGKTKYLCSRTFLYNTLLMDFQTNFESFKIHTLNTVKYKNILEHKCFSKTLTTELT